MTLFETLLRKHFIKSMTEFFIEKMFTNFVLVILICFSIWNVHCHGKLNLLLVRTNKISF